MSVEVGGYRSRKEGEGDFGLNLHGRQALEHRWVHMWARVSSRTVWGAGPQVWTQPQPQHGLSPPPLQPGGEGNDG